MWQRNHVVVYHIMYRVSGISWRKQHRHRRISLISHQLLSSAIVSAMAYHGGGDGKYEYEEISGEA